MNERILGLFLRNIRIDWDKVPKESYVRSIRALRRLKTIDFQAQVTFFAGENGSGKSTLLEAIAVAMGFNPEGGTRNYRFSTFDSHSELHEALSVARGVYAPKHSYFLRAESFYNVSTQENEYAKQGGFAMHFHECSHGEGFLRLMQSQFSKQGIFLFDEPEAALSTTRQMAALVAIYDAAKAGSQFVIATHSPILLGLPDAQILHFTPSGVKPCTYEETESVSVLLIAS